MAEVFTQLDNITSARRARLHHATGLMPSVVWVALYAGALLTVGFDSESCGAQISMTGVLSVLVTLGDARGLRRERPLPLRLLVTDVYQLAAEVSAVRGVDRLDP